jgi:hypothetical protein
MSTGSFKLGISVLLFLYLCKGYVGRQTLAEEFGLGEGKAEIPPEKVEGKGAASSGESWLEAV